MRTRITHLTIGALARASGVSVRTLRHYDAIGLLKPEGTAANGYRIYGQTEALRLQEILFYRQTGLPLAEITSLLDKDRPLDRLLAHRDRLAATLARQNEMIAALDRTIAALKGTEDMTIDDLYRPFHPQKQAEHEAWLIETYGKQMAADIVASAKQFADRPETMNDRMAELRAIETKLVAAFRSGIPASKADLSAHRTWVSAMWGKPCSPQAYAGLADLYLSHPEFVARFERLAPGFSQWLPAAMKATSD